MTNLSRLSPMRGGDTLAKEKRVSKGVFGSQLGGSHNVFIHYPKGPNCEVCKQTKTTRPGVEQNLIRRLDQVQIMHFLIVENESRCGHKNALIVQGGFADWIQSLPMETKETSGTMSCLQRCNLPSQKPATSPATSALPVNSRQQLRCNLRQQFPFSLISVVFLRVIVLFALWCTFCNAWRPKHCGNCNSSLKIRLRRSKRTPAIYVCVSLHVFFAMSTAKMDVKRDVFAIVK